MGAEFLRSSRALGLIVPSAIVREAGNILINPLHPRFPEVTMEISRPFSFDQRLGNRAGSPGPLPISPEDNPRSRAHPSRSYRTIPGRPRRNG
ncbi:MAG: RES family NAD+ phosphorylase [Gammaproteobacteria bacterium]